MEQGKQKIGDFRDMVVWQKGHVFVVSIYRLTQNFPKDEIYGLTSQIRRAAVSITSNIAEGFGRRTHKDKQNFYFHARGSLIEVQNQLLIAKDIGYIQEDIYQKHESLLTEVHKLLNALIAKNKTFIAE